VYTAYVQRGYVIPDSGAVTFGDNALTEYAKRGIVADSLRAALVRQIEVVRRH
jgi:hypothetical protein